MNGTHPNNEASALSDPVSWALRSRRGLAMVRRLRDACSRRLQRFQDTLARKISPNGKVLSGPFAGMLYPITRIGSSMVLPKLLGSYEEELHPTIERAIHSNYTDIVDIGCGEGYYAVGLALRLAHPRVLAFDLDTSALDLTCRLATLNGVGPRVIVAEGCSRHQLRNLKLGARVLILADCEGAEFELIHPAWLPDTAAIDLLVECHDSTACPRMLEELQRRFAATHDATIIHSRSRDPSQYSILDGWSSGEIEMALSESRPPGMRWLSLRQQSRP
jgi:SAM-dependent methyltransferase